jgi:hypothetical protein
MLLWGGAMFLVYDKNYATQKSADLFEIPIDDTITGEFQNWMNVKMGGSKIGYTMQSFSNSPLGYVLKDYSLIRLPMGGTVREIYLDSYAVLNLDFSLKNFSFGLISGDYTTDVFGEVRNGRLNIKLKSQNSRSQASFEAENGVYLPSIIPLLAKVRGFPQGEFSLPTFDPFSLAMNEIQVQIGQKENIGTDIGNQDGYRLLLFISGMSSTMWVDRNGHILREEEAGGMVMTLTDKINALDVPIISNTGVDILTNLAVKCKGRIDNPRELESLKIQVDGVEPGLFDLGDDFQTVVSIDPLVLEIHPRRIEPSTLGDTRRFLSSEPFLQVEDPRIINSAMEIIAGETSPVAKADKLGKWVFNNVEKDYSISLPSAVDVLVVKRGDCNEHTALYTALARAVGIPTKICIGLVYKDGLFYYHAWPAVHLDGWTPLDPTFGQEITDATHIKLLEGGFERQADLMRVVGKISITVIDNSGEKNL